MKITRRSALKLLAAAAPALSAARLLRAADGGTVPPIPAGPFRGTRESLANYQCPEWFRDAKFGIWAHWGPQSAAEYDDWYARRMYVPGEPQYDYHVKTYGHPSKFGFKDVIGTWKAASFDPDYLVRLYKKAGAKYFCSMAVHHDNFDLWNSKHQPKWNSVQMGPKKDIVGLFRDAARKEGLRFAVSDHLSNSFSWFAPAHLSDKDGPLAGVPYDGADPQWADLYHDYRSLPADFAQTAATSAMSRNAPESWKLNYYQRMIDLVDQYQPDLLYTDGGIPFGDYGLNLLAHLYNTGARRTGGATDTVFTSKSREDAAAGLSILDRERGVVDTISPRPWQTDTCIGNWHYHKKIYAEDGYKTPKFVVDMLVDIVSRNGNLMLNVPLPNSGMPDDKELKVIDGIARWMAVNSEGIYATRPWKIFGAGPAAELKAAPGQRFQESGRKDFTAQDVRFTTKGASLYTFFMGWPEKEIVIAPLATGTAHVAGKIENVELLGHPGRLNWQHDSRGLIVQLPSQKPCEHAYVLKIAGLATS
ncbi:MAG: alpha-L-fucosidase [Opitutaceae bacterium]